MLSGWREHPPFRLEVDGGAVGGCELGKGAVEVTLVAERLWVLKLVGGGGPWPWSALIPPACRSRRIPRRSGEAPSSR